MSGIQNWLQEKQNKKTYSLMINRRIRNLTLAVAGASLLYFGGMKLTDPPVEESPAKLGPAAVTPYEACIEVSDERLRRVSIARNNPPQLTDEVFEAYKKRCEEHTEW